MFAGLLESALGRAIPGRHGYALLRGPIPEPSDVVLDSHTQLLATHLDRVASALAALAPSAWTAMTTSPAGSAVAHLSPMADMDDVVDRLAIWLLDRLRFWPNDARRLAVAASRLLEDSAVLVPEARRQRPLGLGFEALFDERLRRRFALLPDHPEQLSALRRWRELVLEEPEQGAIELERDLSRPLAAEDRAWLDVERKVAMLRHVRRNKTEDGHIRWYLRRDDRHGVVLDRYGVAGHWLVCGDECQTDLARLGTAVERVLTSQGSGDDTEWRLVTTTETDVACHDDSAPNAAYLLPPQLTAETNSVSLRANVRRHLVTARFTGMTPVWRALAAGQRVPDATSRARRFAIRADDEWLSLVDEDKPDDDGSIARVRHNADDDQLLDFLESVDRVADLSAPADQVDARASDSPSVVWTRALLRTRDQRIAGTSRATMPMSMRLIYVPSSIAHQLGGVPLVGLEFLRDRMERLGARVDILTLPAHQFDARLVELLGADVIGIGVYIHNRDEVAALVSMLRQAGYAGKIILGGPQLREVDHVQASIDGWDALIRGEAEDVLPSVLDVLRDLDRGLWADALTRARKLIGVVIRYGRAVLLCDTARRNRAKSIVCPQPYDWMRGRSKRDLQMNFTRGCPYLCTFCPNHQGQRFRAGTVEQLWQFTALAVADDFQLPPAAERGVARRIQEELAIDTSPRLRVALHLLLRTWCTAEKLDTLLASLREVTDPELRGDPAVLHNLVGVSDTVDKHLRSLAGKTLTAWQLKKAWLLAKLEVLATRQRQRRSDKYEVWFEDIDKSLPGAFVLTTSEDNTLVNRMTVQEYLARRRRFGLHKDVIFNPGQNTVWDLTDRNGNADTAYIMQLVDQNPFAVALGVDGPSNVIIRQNRKPRYGVREVVAVNRALASHGVTVANNYIMLTPETNLLEAVEGFALFLILPISWRDYGHAINLRVIKEEGTLAHDEGLIFAPDDDSYDVPIRFPEVRALLNRWELTSRVSSEEVRPLLWRILADDQEVAAVLPMVVRRWLRDFDSDPELLALGRLISARSAPDVPLVRTLREIRDHLASEPMANTPYRPGLGRT